MMARPGPFTATALALLLLSTAGVLNFARGSFVSQGDEVLSDIVFGALRGQVGQLQAQAWNRKDLPSVAAGEITRLPRGYGLPPASPGGLLALDSEMVHQASTVNGRNLQQSDCADGASPIAVTSTAFPLLEGCLGPVTLDDGAVAYSGETSVIISEDASVSTDPSRWVAYYVTGTDDFTGACVSLESSDDVDPSEATWYCDFGGDSFEAATDEQLSVSCGCAISSSSSSFDAPTPSPVVSTTPATSSGAAPTTSSSAIPSPASSTAASTCDEGDTFSVSSETLPEIEECYYLTDTVSNGSPVYTETGGSEYGQIFMLATPISEDDDAPIVWALLFLAATSSDNESEVYCISLVEAAYYHPSDVTNWSCYGDTEAITSVDCGCSSTSSAIAPSPAASSSASPPAEAPTSREIPAPEPSPTSTASTPAPSQATGTTPVVPTEDDDDDDDDDDASMAPVVPTEDDDDDDDDASIATSVPSTCTGDGSFTISASAATTLDGCYQDTGSADADGMVFYSVSGTKMLPEVWVYSAVTDTGDSQWIIADSDGSGSYCYSEEAASEVNPGDASWNCDFTGGGSAFSLASATDISITCGSCAGSVLEEGTSAASKMTVGIVTAGGAGIVAVASAWGGW